ncbi:MAG TPA: DUF924 domain-containing protein [Porticoccaceae bacterium]|nr:DUF924 domain-containing protein [Porticoccaceae bacterium]
MTLVYREVINFWFEQLTPKQWWQKSPDLDKAIRDRFSDLHRSSVAGELYHWRIEPLGRLAEIIVLDQFSRQIYRDLPQAFAQDSMALVLAQHAIDAGADNGLDANQTSFLYMPFMHSESQMIHRRAVELFSQPGLERNLHFELRHKAIIDRFGRYPHRNNILGRPSTPEELAFLQQPGSAF